MMPLLCLLVFFLNKTILKTIKLKTLYIKTLLNDAYFRTSHPKIFNASTGQLLCFLSHIFRQIVLNFSFISEI